MRVEIHLDNDIPDWGTMDQVERDTAIDAVIEMVANWMMETEFPEGVVSNNEKCDHIILDDHNPWVLTSKY